MKCRVIVFKAAMLVLTFMMEREAVAQEVGRGTSQMTPADSPPALPTAAERNIVTFLLGAERWAGLGELSPMPPDFSPAQAGKFNDLGYGIEVSYHRLLPVGRFDLLLGGELAGFDNENRKSVTLVNFVTGEKIRDKLFANSGHLTGSCRLVIRGEKRVAYHVGSGLGLYLLRIKEAIEGFGVAETGHNDSSFGGFVVVGIEAPTRFRTCSLRFEGKVHYFVFDHVGEFFPGQEARGPLYELEFGAAWRS